MIKKEYPAQGGLPAFMLVYKKIKRINLRFTPEGKLLISAPERTPLKEIKRAISENIGWINAATEKHRARTAARPQHENGGAVVLAGQEYPLTVMQGSRKAGEYRFSDCGVVVTVPDPEDSALIEKQLEKLLHEQAEQLFRESLERMYPLVQPLGAPLPELKQRRMTSRWGSCNTQTHVITLNTCLARAPLPLIDSVMLHELIHLLNRPHDARFHQLSAMLMPDYRERRERLNSLDLIY